MTAVFVDPWPWWAAGLAIGLFAVLLAWATGRLLGISSGYGSICAVGSRLEYFRGQRGDWKFWFVVGLPLGGLAARLLAGAWEPTMAMGAFDASISTNPWIKGAVLFAGGAMVGFGSRWANGCTSGHSIVGIAQGAKSSLIATVGFMAAGVAVAHLLFAVIA
jgi:uncharacterized membrane protein YedE/YeeE